MFSSDARANAWSSDYQEADRLWLLSSGRLPDRQHTRGYAFLGHAHSYLRHHNLLYDSPRSLARQIFYVPPHHLYRFPRNAGFFPHDRVILQRLSYILYDGHGHLSKPHNVYLIYRPDQPNEA